MIEIYFWGVRGSFPSAGKSFVKYGGNTSCVSVEYKGKSYIFDCGTGIMNLGQTLTHIKEATLFLSHSHYDHVIGLPFFSKIWDKNFNLDIYAGTLAPYGGTKSFFQHYLFGHPFFPVNASNIPSKLNFHDFIPGHKIKLNENVYLNTMLLDHPGDSVGYALYLDDKKICYITDTGTDDDKFKKNIGEFIADADVCIYDSTFIDEEKVGRESWKHSSWQDAVYLAKDAKVKNMFLYHHSPTRGDDELDAIAIEAKKVLENVIVAQEGSKIII